MDSEKARRRLAGPEGGRSCEIPHDQPIGFRDVALPRRTAVSVAPLRSAGGRRNNLLTVRAWAASSFKRRPRREKSCAAAKAALRNGRALGPHGSRSRAEGGRWQGKVAGKRR